MFSESAGPTKRQIYGSDNSFVFSYKTHLTDSID